MAKLSIRCLGRFELGDAGSEDIAVTSEKHRLLLAMIALSPGRTLGRSELMTALWGDRGEEQSRGSLRHALWSLRKDLGKLADQFLESHGQQLRLRDTEVDVAAFEAAVADASAEALGRALELYRGDLLEEFDLAGLDPYGTLLVERERLRNVAVRAAKTLVRMHQEADDLPSATKMARRALLIDPLQEDVHRTLIGLYRDRGQSGLAVKQYNTCRDVLAELGVAPSAETEALRRSLAAPVAGAVTASRKPTQLDAGSPVALRPGLLRFGSMRYLAAFGGIAAAFVFSAGYMFADLTERPAARPHIAVLPFQDMSVGNQQPLYSAGLTADIITDLAKLSGIEVIARDSVRAIHAADASILEIAEALNVDYVLRGNVRRSRGQVRINAQLIDASTGQHIWAERFDRDAEDLFEVQDEVVRQVVTTLAVGISETEQAAVARIPTESLEAYDHFLRAEYNTVDVAGTESRRSKLQAYRTAIGLDPGFADAHAGYARALVDVWRLDMTDVMSSTVAKKAAYAAANDALQLDPQNARALTALALIQLSDSQQGAAVASARNAAAIAPGNADVQADLAVVLAQTGQADAAREALAKAHELNPALPPRLLVASGIVAFEEGQFAAALEYLEQALDKVPTSEWANVMALAAHGLLGDTDGAHEARAQLLEAFPIANLNYYRVAQSQMRTPVQTSRFLHGLELVGLGEWPYGVDPDFSTRVAKGVLDEHVFGRTWVGFHHSGTPFLQENGHSGKFAYRSDLSLRTGLISVEDGQICETSDGNLPSGKSCGRLHMGGREDADFTLLMPESVRYFRISE